MSNDLLTQLSDYGAYCEELQGSVAADDVTGGVLPRLVPVESGRPRHLWLVGVAAATLVLVLVGGIAWFGPFGGEPPPATDEPIVPPGEGPKLTFVQAELPGDDSLESGVWFEGAMYALVRSTTDLYRTTDGFTWEPVPGLPDVAWDIRRSMLQTDGERLVMVVMPGDGGSGIRDDRGIVVGTSTNGVDWTSSTIELPVPGGSNMAGEFHLADTFYVSDNFAVGPGGIVVTATISLEFEGEGFANSLVDADEGIHVEVVDLDLERGVMIVAFLDEENDMEQIGDLREIDLRGTGFSGAFSNLLDAMAADPDWDRVVPGFIAQLAGEMSTGSASVSVGYAWFSADGVAWERVDSTGPLDGGEFAAIATNGDGFIATASNTYKPDRLPPDLRNLTDGFDNTIVWQSVDGTTWSEAPGFTSTHGTNDTALADWQGELIELVGWVYSVDDDVRPMTLAEPRRALFEIPTGGMWLDISEFGLIGTPSSGWWGPDATELLFSVDGTTWNRWEPTEFDIGSDPSTGERRGSVGIVGIGEDFVVLELGRWDEEARVTVRTLWVGTIG